MSWAHRQPQSTSCALQQQCSIAWDPESAPEWNCISSMQVSHKTSLSSTTVNDVRSRTRSSTTTSTSVTWTLYEVRALKMDWVSRQMKFVRVPLKHGVREQARNGLVPRRGTKWEADWRHEKANREETKNTRSSIGRLCFHPCSLSRVWRRWCRTCKECR